MNRSADKSFKSVCILLNLTCIIVVLISLDSDVTFLTPICSPRVSNNPVILSKTNNNDCMVFYFADAFVENSLLIKHEIVIRMNNSSKWTLSQSLLHLDSSLHFFIDRNLQWTTWMGAVVLGSFVWILFLSYDSILSRIFQWLMHITTFTAKTYAFTINELLFW